MEGVVDIEDAVQSSPEKQSEDASSKEYGSKVDVVSSDVQLNISSSNIEEEAPSGKKSKYSCVQCPFTSFYPGNLRVHMRRHTGSC